MAILFIITHELVTLEQIISKRNYSHLYNNGIATSELTIDHHFWSQFAFLHTHSLAVAASLAHCLTKLLPHPPTIGSLAID